MTERKQPVPISGQAILKRITGRLEKLTSPIDIKRAVPIDPGTEREDHIRLLEKRIARIRTEEKRLETVVTMLEKELDAYDAAVTHQMIALKALKEDEELDNFVENRQKAREAQKLANLARIKASSSQASNCAIIGRRHGIL